MKLLLLLSLLGCCLEMDAQTAADPISIVNAGPDCSIRGMSIPSDGVIWISGSKGQVARSTDTGKTWQWMTVLGYERTDFRDIHAFDANTAVIMGIDNPSYILKTKDGGRSWKQVFTKDTAGMFLDAMDFKNGREGICIGDPLPTSEGKRQFFIIRSMDGGDSWQQEPIGSIPAAAEGEAVFSASGTNIALLDRTDYAYAFISGGLVSRLYLIGRKGTPCITHSLPIRQGQESSGAFSMATDGRNRFYCIGGDYKAPDDTAGNLAWTKDRGLSWKRPGLAAPGGYRSCIRIIEGESMVACGSNGVDICDEPEQWRRVSNEGFNVCMVSPNRNLIFFAGAKGKVGVMRR